MVLSTATLKDAVAKALYSHRIAVIPEWRLGAFPLTQHIRSVIAARSIDVVIDVGANVGGFAQMMRREVGYVGPVISFEPVAAVFSKLKKASGNDPQWSVFQTAIGSLTGTSSINVTAATEFNSFLVPKKDSAFSEWSDITGQEEVPVTRLDEFFETHQIIPRNLYLKTDTQGFDLEVLRGSSEIMDGVQAIQIELSMRPIYEGSPSHYEVLEALTKMGFAVSGMFPVSLTDMVAVEMDCILVRERVLPQPPQTYASVVKRGVLFPRRLQTR